MTRKTFIIRNEAVRDNALAAVKGAPIDCVVVIQESIRSLEQNRLMWPLLEDISRVVKWAGHLRHPELWKAGFLQLLDKEVTILPSLDDSGILIIYRGSSSLSKSEFSDLIELIYKYGAENEVVFRDPRTTPDGPAGPPAEAEDTPRDTPQPEGEPDKAVHNEGNSDVKEAVEPEEDQGLPIIHSWNKALLSISNMDELKKLYEDDYAAKLETLRKLNLKRHDEVKAVLRAEYTTKARKLRENMGK